MVPSVGDKAKKRKPVDIDQAETQPVDVMHTKTPEVKENLTSPDHSAEQKREVYHTKGGQPKQHRTDDTTPENQEGKRQPQECIKEAEEFTSSDVEEGTPYHILSFVTTIDIKDIMIKNMSYQCGNKYFAVWGIHTVSQKWFSCQTFHIARIRFGTFQPALGLYWQVGPKQASTTRLDQLMMKQKRKEKDQQDGKEEGAPPTRGRGQARGRGKGRGRGGRGASKGVDDGSEKEAKPKATKPKNSKGDTKERDPKDQKKKCNIGKEIWFGYTLDEWAAWGTDGAWSQTFDEQKDKEAWAWDSTAYWDQRSSAYALSKSQQPSGSSQAKPRRQTAKTTNPASKRKETKENEYDTADLKPKAKKGKTPMEIEDGEVAEKKKTPKNATKQAATHDLEDKEKHEPEGKTRSHSTKRKQKDQVEQPEEKAAKLKRRRETHVNYNPETGAGSSTDRPEPSKVLHATWEGRVQEILNFIELVKDVTGDNKYEVLRSRLAAFSACRMNVYWSRAAIGVTCRAEKTDVGYFSSPTTDGPRLIRMAAAFKAAEMLATCRH